MKKALRELNLRSWNTATVVHNRHKGDQAAFFRHGGSTLFPEERELLGDVTGLRLLQCNTGQDTPSLMRDGADATGVDIADEATGFTISASPDPALYALAPEDIHLERPAN